MTEGPAPWRSALGSHPAAAAPIAYSSLTLSVLGPTGIDPSLPDCCPCRYSIARDAGSTCVAALPVPKAKASSAAPVAPVGASAATLLVLPMSAPHAAKGTPPLPELSSPHEASSRRARGWRSTPGSVSWLADQHRPRPPSREVALPVARWPPAPRSQLRDSAGFSPASPHPGRYSDFAVQNVPGPGGVRHGL